MTWKEFARAVQEADKSFRKEDRAEDCHVQSVQFVGERGISIVLKNPRFLVTIVSEAE